MELELTFEDRSHWWATAASFGVSPTFIIAMLPEHTVRKLELTRKGISIGHNIRSMWTGLEYEEHRTTLAWEVGDGT